MVLLVYYYYDVFHHFVYSFTSNFELLLTRGIRLFNKNKALRSFFGLKVSLTQCDFCPVLWMSMWRDSTKRGLTAGVTMTLLR